MTYVFSLPVVTTAPSTKKKDTDSTVETAPYSSDAMPSVTISEVDAETELDKDVKVDNETKVDKEAEIHERQQPLAIVEPKPGDDNTMRKRCSVAKIFAMPLISRFMHVELKLSYRSQESPSELLGLVS